MRLLPGAPRAFARRVVLDYRVTPHASVGLEANPTTGEVQPRSTWFATAPGRGAPGVSVGLSSDRMSVPRGHAGFVTLTQPIPRTPVSVFGGLKYTTDDRRLGLPFGANLSLAPQWVLQSQYDGRYAHLVLTRSIGDGSVSVLYGRTRFLGLQATVAF